MPQLMRAYVLNQCSKRRFLVPMRNYANSLKKMDIAFIEQDSVVDGYLSVKSEQKLTYIYLSLERNALQLLSIHCSS